MVTTVIKGGLGNQLFQFASAYALSQRIGQSLSLDISFYSKQSLRSYKLDKLSLPDDVSISPNNSLSILFFKNRLINRFIRRSRRFNLSKIKFNRDTTYLVELAGRYVPLFFEINDKNIFMNGYYQSEDYFKEYRNTILKFYTPSYPLDDEFVSVLKDIQNCNSVAIHVRHGDFMKIKNSSFHYILDEHYYTKAISYIQHKTNNPSFFVFSDDIEWVKEHNLGIDNFKIISLHTPNADIDEMMLMKSCNHIIAANSTFSWWAAWLNNHNNAIRITPNKPYGQDRLIPKTWIRI